MHNTEQRIIPTARNVYVYTGHRQTRTLLATHAPAFSDYSHLHCSPTLLKSICAEHNQATTRCNSINYRLIKHFRQSRAEDVAYFSRHSCLHRSRTECGRIHRSSPLVVDLALPPGPHNGQLSSVCHTRADMATNNAAALQPCRAGSRGTDVAQQVHRSLLRSQNRQINCVVYCR